MENYGYVSAMRKYFNFRDRAPRKEYWMFTLIYLIMSIGAIVLDGFLFGFEIQPAPEDGIGGGFSTTGPFGAIIGLVHFIPSLAVTVRRLHDIGRSGWWILILFIPLIGIFILLYWMIKGSEPGANKWGPNPYGVASAEVFD